MIAISGQPQLHRLSFASQMIVWAMRKRLHLLARGASEENVIEAFRFAGLENAYAALMSIVNLLLCGPAHRVQLHAVACPCLSPHEIHLLNALAHRQADDSPESERHLGRLFCFTAARLIQPAVDVVVDELNARGLRLTAIGVEGDVAPGPARGRLH